MMRSMLAVLGFALAQGVHSQEVAVRIHASPEAISSANVDAKHLQHLGAFAWARLAPADIDKLRSRGVMVDLVPEDVRVGAARVVLQSPAQVASKSTGRNLYLVQFNGPARAAWTNALESAEVLALQYYPNNAYLVWADSAALSSLGAMPMIRGAAAFDSALRIDASVRGVAAAIEDASIFLFNSGSPTSLETALRARGVALKHFYPAQPDGRFYRALGRIDAGALASIAELPEVVWIGRESEPELDDEMANQTFARNFAASGIGNAPGYLDFLKTIGVPWDLGLSGAGVIWGVTDSGTDWNHPDLGVARVGGFDAPGCSAQTLPGDDTGGHGTHVSGSVAGRGTGDFSGPAAETDANGFAYGQGVAPAAGLFAVRSIGCGSMTNPERVRIPMAAGARGSNNSWNNSSSSPQIRYLASEREYDILVRDGDFNNAGNQAFSVMFSAGNAGPGVSTLTGPHVAKNIVSVASSNIGRATAASSNNISSFSSRGPAEDGRVLPTITGVGGSTGSTRRAEGGSCGTAFAGTNNLYSSCSGTSMSTPMVSGAAALVHEWWGKKFAGAVPSPAMVKAVLINGAYDLPGTGTSGSNDGSLPIPNNDEGWGQVDLKYTFDPNLRGLYRDQEDVLTATGQTRTFTVAAVDPGKPLKITLVWSDAPGAVAANPALVNDLDLSVVSGGQTYRGNVFSGGSSTTGGSFDRLNNVENVFLNAPGNGATTITLTAAAINADALAGNGSPGAPAQDYALVCTNCREAGVAISAAPGTINVCGATPTNVNLSFASIAAFAGNAALSLNGAPSGLDVAFAPSTVNSGSSTLTLTPQAGLQSGVYPALLRADVSGGADDERALALWVSSAIASVPGLVEPADAQTGLKRATRLSWQPVAGALRYRVDVSDSNAFTAGPSTQSFETQATQWVLPELPPGATRFWRVVAINACGESVASAVRSFTTAAAVCSQSALPIPDGNSGGATQTLTVPGSTIGDLDISINAAHTSAGQLALRLTHVASNVEARLYTKQNNCTGDDVNGTFNDDSGAIIACRTAAPAISGTLRPQDDLARFIGLPAGDWRLTVIDDAAGESGTVNQWCVIAAGAEDGLFANGFE